MFTKNIEKTPRDEYRAKLQKSINLRNKMREFITQEYFTEVLRWNGKVYNKRFRDAVSRLLPSDLWRIEENDYSKNRISLNIYSHRVNYTPYESVWVPLVRNENNRICADETEAQLKGEWLKNFDSSTAEKRYAFEHYDECLEIARKMFEAIAEFNKIPYAVRDNIERTSYYLY